MRWTIAVTASLAALLAAGGCKVKDPPPIKGTFEDGFQRTQLGGNYYETGGDYHIDDGALSTQGAYNHPLWLRKKLPRNVMVELDAWSNTPDGDIKVELFGDGSSHARNKGAYTATGYVFVMGGWSNKKSILARMDEHGKDLVQRTEPKVEVGKKYHWKIVRRGNEVEWFVDDMDTPFLRFEDPNPLEGPGHQYFGFNNWESDSYFDNLVITQLPE